MSNYLKKFKVELENRNYARNTIKAYLYKLKAYFIFASNNKERAAVENISNFINSKKGEVSKRHSYYAIKLFYQLVLNKNCPYNLKKIKIRERIPTYLNKEEIQKILSCINNKTHFTMIAMLYGSGLRVSEIVNLRVTDIDLINNIIFIKDAKGHKDRITILSDKLVPNLKFLLKDKDASSFLFQTNKNKKYSIRTVQKIFETALLKSRVQKKASCHSLRHSFAMHLLDSGVDIRKIKNLLGHKSIKTTMIYLQKNDINEIKIKSPL